MNGEIVQGPWRWCWESGLLRQDGSPFPVNSGKAVDSPAALKEAKASFFTMDGMTQVEPRLYRVWRPANSPFGPPQSGSISLFGWLPLDREEDQGLLLLMDDYRDSVQETTRHFNFNTSFRAGYLGLKYMIFPWDDIPSDREDLAGDEAHADLADFFRGKLDARKRKRPQHLVDKAIDVMEGIGKSPPVYVELDSCT